MENPLYSPDSQLPGQNESAIDKTVKFSNPQIKIEPAEESRPQKLEEETKDSVPEDQNEPVQFSKPEIIVNPLEESRPQKLEEETKDSVPEDQNEPVQFSKRESIVEPPQETRTQNLNEQAQDGEPQDQPAQDHRLQEAKETEEDLNQLAAPEKSAAEAHVDRQEKMSPDKEESPLPSSSEGQDVSTTGDIPASKPSLDDDAQGLPEQATDSEPQALKAQMAAVVDKPEKPAQDMKEGTPRIVITGVQGKTLKTEVASRPSSCESKKCSHSCGHSSRAAKPMFSWSPAQLAKATLRPKPRLQTADKATQIFPGRVPRLSKLQPKRVLPPKPRPPSADKATEISPSFEKLLKRPLPLVKKKNKNMSTMTMTRVWPQTTRSPNVRPIVSSRRSRSSRASADRPPLRVRSSKTVPLRGKNPKDIPLRVKFSSSSPTKHRLNLSYCPQKKRKIICNLCITFCDNWEEPKLDRVQQTHWEESLPSCSGLYRACSVFSTIRCGQIRVSHLLLALHTLGILVTSGEMHQILHLVSVDEHGSLNFSEFLEAVNATSPFAETEGFQNALQAFRKMKKGMVSAKELESILLYLGITLSPEMVQQTLGRMKANKNGKFDISDFFLAAKDLQRVLEEEDEAFLKERTVFRRRPFQDVADLVDAECRRRKKYWDFLDEEAPTPARHLSLMTWRGSAAELDLGKQKSRTSSLDLGRSSSAFPEIMIEEEAKDGDVLEGTTSQMGLSSDLKSSSHESLVNNAKLGNKDANDAELEKSQMDLLSQNTEDPVPS